MSAALYFSVLALTFFCFLFIYTKVYTPGKWDKASDDLFCLCLALVGSMLWPISIPACLLSCAGWFFIKFLRKGEK
jgi:uncharacterized membrane protein YjfL (UPF0719 family)